MVYQFNHFTLDTLCFELRKGDKVLAAEPQVLELLVFLVENHERMVSKEEINEVVWKGRVVSDAALSSRIKTARQLLGDNGRDQMVIKTIHKKGFRFIASVDKNGDEDTKSTRLSTEGQSRTQTNALLENNHLAKVQKPAVAVLPFSNLSNDQSQEYFSDGITADVIAHLARHKWLNVSARNTSFGYKNKAVDVRQIGDELNVRYVVEGSVQRAGDRVRITVSLIDAHSGNQCWAERYNREIADIFTLQDEITETVVARLEPEIGFAERSKVVLQRPSNLQAWDCYHLGMYHLFKFTGEDNEQAQLLLRQSQDLDEYFGEAFAWWAYAVILGMVYWNTAYSQDLLDEALTACNKALSIDSQNASFFALKARILLARKEYDQAIAENEIAIRLNPTLSSAYCGLGDSLAYEGRYKESMQSFEKAIALSPNDPQLWAFYTYGALALLFDEKFEEALEWTKHASSIPNYQYWTTAHRMVALAYLNRKTEADEAKAMLLKENPGFTKQFAEEKLFYIKDQSQIDLYLKGLTLAGVK